MTYYYPKDKHREARDYDRIITRGPDEFDDDDELDELDKADRDYDEMREELIRERYNEREA